MAYENTFLGAKRLENGMVSIKVNLEEAEKYSSFYQIAFVAYAGAGMGSVIPINAFAGEFRQNEMNYVDTFPNMVHYIKNYHTWEAPGCLNFYVGAEDVYAVNIHIVDRMQQYNQPAEIITLEVEK